MSPLLQGSLTQEESKPKHPGVLAHKHSVSYSKAEGGRVPSALMFNSVKNRASLSLHKM